jgi:small-conductance mechanosensitive channel
MAIRRIAFVAFLLAATLCVSFAQTQADDPGTSLLAFLNQSIDWYHRVQLLSQLSNDPSDSIYTTYNRTAGLQAVALILDFGRIQAEQMQLDHSHDAPAASNTAQPATLSQRVASAQDKVKQITAGLDIFERQAATAGGKKLQTINNQTAELKSDLELARARLEVLQSMNAFTSTAVSAGLPGKIDELERTVPEVRVVRSAELSARSAHSESNNGETLQNGNHGRAASGTLSDSPAANPTDVSRANGSMLSSAPSTGPVPFSPLSASPLAAAAASATQPSNGIISLAEDLNSLHGKLDAERDALAATAQFHRSLDRIRDPLRTQLRAINQRDQSLSAHPQSDDPVVLADRRKQIEALTADFKHLAAMVLPLAKVDLLLDATSNNLAEWQCETQRTYSTQQRALLLRIGALLLAIILVGVAADFWRRAIFRYIQEPRRRNQFLLLRRIVVMAAIVLILILALSTDIGSLATFAGFLTAGIAIALQNVILSVAAYFLLIGRFGIRVGDRVQIGEVTGDVFDIGLVRMLLVELDTSAGEARATGRIVVFSNSVVFQPSANFFKQLPGSNFAWRRISLTLNADVDYDLAKQRISAAVTSVYETYKSELEKQHRVLENSLTIHIASTEPQTRLRLKQAGLEIVILYPVVLTRAAQIDDLMTHALLEAIEGEPRLRLVGGGLANIEPVDATPHQPTMSAPVAVPS